MYNAYGAISQIAENYIKAIDYYQESLKIGEKINDLRGQSVTLGNIGAMYIELGDNEMALKYQKRCLSVLLKLNDEENLASVYNNMSIIYTNLKNYDLSMQYAQKSTHIYRKINDASGLSRSLANLANIHEIQKHYEEALKTYFEALKYAEINENELEIGRMHNEIGHLYLLKKNLNEAKIHLDKSLKILQKIDYLDGLIQTHEYLYQYHKEKGNNKEALINLEKNIELKEQQAKEFARQEVNRKLLEIEYEKRAAADSVRMADERMVNMEKIKAKNAEIEKANTQKTAFIAIAIILLVVSFIIYNRFRLIQQQKIIIEEKNRQTEEQKLIIEQKQKEILDSINYAKRIQDSLLDNQETIRKFFASSFILNKPKDIVSGDFYWISKKIYNKPEGPDGKSEVIEQFFLAVCDSTGHGVPGGFMSLLNMAYLSEAINEKNIIEPAKILDYVRERLINTISKHEQKDGFDGVLLRFEKKQQFDNKKLAAVQYGLEYAAAYNAPILIKNGVLNELKSDKMPVGYGEKQALFTQYGVPLEKGDTIYVYTDGYADQFGGPKGKKFKFKKLNELLLNISSKPFNEQLYELETQFNEWKGELEQVDDVCIIGIQI